MPKARQQYFADEYSIQKEKKEFAIEDSVMEKINSIESWAQVNVIETVKVNWEALTPDQDKAIDITVPWVEDNLYSTSTTDALSAKQWKVLYEYIQNLASRGRYLSNWNCTTWLAMTNPVDNPYEYRAWDYYVVSVVAQQWGTNYRPNWTEYTIWLASTTVETDVVKISDFYTYDWTQWLLLVNTEREIAVDSALSPTSTNPVENRVVTAALGTKQDTISDLSTIRSGAAAGATALQPWDSLSQLTWTADDITEWSTNLFLTTAERTKLWNTTWTNTWDETNATIRSKLWVATTSTDGYLTSTDWNTFNWKQDAISDLSTIRSNASAGKSASDTIATYGDIVTHDVSEFATAAQGALADTAIQPNDNISELTNDVWYVTDAYHDSSKQDTLIAWTNIQIAADWKTISATDTTYVPWDFDIKDLADTTWLRTEWSWKQDELIAWTNIQIAADWKTISATDTTYTAWPGITISNNNVISSIDDSAVWWQITWTLADQTDLNTILTGKQDTLTAWANITIDANNEISSHDTTYTAGVWISIDANNVISNTNVSAEWWNIIWTLSDQTDLQTELDKKMENLVFLSYGISTWNDFVAAYGKNVYCRASSNSNPAQWDQTRCAFMAYINNPDVSLATEVEFQYYRSLATHSDSAQWDEVYVYKLNKNTWRSVTKRNAYTKIVAWSWIGATYNNWELTLSAGLQVDDTAYASSWDWVTTLAPSKNAVYDKLESMATDISWKQDPIIAWTNIQIAADWKTISATDTTYIAGTNIQINGTTISATDTTYVASDFDIKDLADSTSLRTTWSWKQDAISDLSTIRSGAAAWATAVQPNDNVSSLTNDAWYITKAVSDLTNYYTKSETYTKSEVADYVANFAWFKVVATLPTTDIKTTVIYLLWPVGSGADKYEEYIYSNNTWVMIWETSVDLSNYFNYSTQTSDDITEWSTNLFLTSAERTKLWNTSWTNSGDETKTTIQTKLWAASTSTDWYLTSTDWNTFNWKANASDVLTKTNTTSYTPSADYNPATKKYVDDAVTAAASGSVSDEAYSSTWDWVGWIAPSKNAVYDKISAMDTTIAGKQDELTAWSNITIGDVCESDMQWPAPSGFHVPLNTEWQAVYDIWTALWGWSIDWTNFWITLKLPMAGNRHRSTSAASSQGLNGYYWSSSSYDESNAYRLIYNDWNLNPQSNERRSYGYSVRCFKNSPVVPDNTWTKLYWTSIEAGWIFWSATDWLISMSSNWTTWITIADKNLWATTVWNGWDALTDANCWWYFQWWNNYMFPTANSSETITTSSSKVNVTWYWPWNYYSSSTWITTKPRQDSTNNGNNLWWWVTQWEACSKIISATNTTYESKAAVQNGTDVSLVTTWEKYIWNNKADTAIVSDTFYWSSWDWDITHAASKNAVYDKINSMDTTISGKQATLVSWTNIKSVNGNSLLGSWDLNVNENVFIRQSDYDNLPSSKTSDWKTYIIFDWLLSYSELTAMTSVDNVITELNTAPSDYYSDLNSQWYIYNNSISNSSKTRYYTWWRYRAEYSSSNNSWSKLSTEPA